MGCALASSDPEFNDYRTQLEQFLNRKQAGKPIEVPIKVIAYRTNVDVDSRGRRLTLGSYHQLQRKRAENRLVAGQWEMTSAQWSNLIGWVQRIEPTYSHAQAEAFLNQFDYASDVRLSHYQLMLQRIEQEGIDLASVKPNAKDSDGSLAPTRSEGVMASPLEEQAPLAKRARIEAVVPTESLDPPAPSTSQIEAVAPPEPLDPPAPSTSQSQPVNNINFLQNRDYWTKRVIEKFSSLEQGKQQALQILQTLYPAEMTLKQ
ncbi:hypothetical protein Rin_00019650 [Candidatus Regiella insecticola 5.15]|uniref:Uncharacterized protein n=1 Tax=Candidatus Regiella insecticola 5.15 TaxID=1005043 RepID=G2H1M2_9ENTR|nr:hypothetical protein Rin_00019650 [Candidatus Regiella insecticola 5.15]